MPPPPVNEQPGAPSLAASQAAAWIACSRSWAATASAHAGAPAPLVLLPSAPMWHSPAWRQAPSWAAAAALLVPPAAGAVASSADVAAAAAVASGAGLMGRTLWALGGRCALFVYATPYPHLDGVPHRQRDLLPATLNLLRVPSDHSRSSSSTAPPGSGVAAAAVQQPEQAQQQQQQQQQQAAELFREIAADQRLGALRILGYLLAHLFRWLFNSELYVDTAGLQRLRGLREGGPAKAALVFIPAHKSHLDYLLLSYVLFASGLPCPHIAAGANLSLPLVGRVLRSCGAFFIRRSSRGALDAHLYKAVLAAYVHALLKEGHSLEFFIEGGRSRDGRVNTPKLGMLRMVVDALAAGDVGRPVLLVPTAMNYDAVLEERSLAEQLAGAPKKSESLAGLAGTCWGILCKALRARWQRWALGLGAGGYCGRATVAFGEPISLQAWLQQHRDAMHAGGSAARHAVAELGEQVTAGIRTANVVPTAALLVGALFAERHLLVPAEHKMPPSANGVHANGSADGCRASAAVDEAAAAHAVVASMDWLADELAQRGAAVVRLPKAAQPSGGGEGDSGAAEESRHRLHLLRHLAGMLPHCCSTVLQPQPAAPGGGGGGSAAQPPPALRLDVGVQAALLQHSRLNQLLPWLAAEGLLVAALLGGAVQCGSGTAGHPAGCGRSEAEVLESAAWLRCLLAPEIDTALRPSALGSAQDFEPALQRLLSSGALKPAAAGELGGPAGPGGLRLAGSGASRRAALLTAALLAPLLATYCEALRAMQAALAAAGLGGASGKDLCSAAQKHLLRLAATCSSAGSSGGSGAAARLALPSTALVQGALRSFVGMGALVPAAGAPVGLAASVSAALAVAAEPSACAATAAEADTAASSPADPLPEENSFADVVPADSHSGLSSSGSSGALSEGVDAAEPPTPAPTPTAVPPDGAAEGDGRSLSGSDSEQDPAADSVAANLCRLDGSPSPVQSASAGAGTAEARPMAAPASAALAATAYGQQGIHWVLGLAVAEVAQLADRLESFICI